MMVMINKDHMTYVIKWAPFTYIMEKQMITVPQTTQWDFATTLQTVLKIMQMPLRKLGIQVDLLFRIKRMLTLHSRKYII